MLLQSALDSVITGSPIQLPSTTTGRGLVLETNSEGLYAENTLFLGGQYSILMNHASAGSPPKQHSFHQVAGDGAGSASWQINACKRSRMTNCWAASVQNLARGVSINNAGGNTAGLVWDGGIVLNCGAEGIQINGGSDNYMIINNYLRGNQTSGLADGGSGANKVVCNNIL